MRSIVLAAAFAGIAIAAVGAVAGEAGEADETIRVEEVTYSAGGVTLKGTLAWDAAVKGPRPGVLVVHEWWGRNDYAVRRARMLAGLGYTAMALDMYGGGRTATDPAGARKLVEEVMADPAVARQRFEAALAVLRKHETTDPARVAAIGYCFGGGVVLAMARAGVDLDGVVSFHGSLATESPATPDTLKAAVLVLHGAADPLVPPADVAAFHEEMAKAAADLTFVAYPGAKHAFTNPAATAAGAAHGLPVAYHAEADRRSWAAMERFLARVLAPE